MELNSLRFSLTQYQLVDWDLIKVTGADRENFFQGQVTNDLLSLEMGNAQLTTRLNRVGKIQSFFFIARTEESLYILCQKMLTDSILEDFNKFIIMDDVELSPQKTELWLLLNPSLSEKREKLFSLNFFGIESALLNSKSPDVPLADIEELEKIRQLNGYPFWGKDIDSTMFVNDTFLNEVGISYKKGCFLGQETVAKIENNRGAAYYPVNLILEKAVLEKLEQKDFMIDDRKGGHILYHNDNILTANLFRDFRVEARSLDIVVDGKTYQAKVQYLPFYKNQKPKELALELYHIGVEYFQKNNNSLALQFMQKSISFDPTFADAYESIGVILGREERYNEAIEWMDKLLLANSSSVMAHTNKSLYLMKLGKIEEAEAEKATATVKSFAMFGEEAKLKKAMEAEKQKKEDDINRREKMFLQVLEIDEEDTIALYGLGDIAFHRNQFDKAVEQLSKVIAHDPKYSMAYLQLGKAYEALGNVQMAHETFSRGIEVASKQGDMMPANDMQSRLNQLIVSSRLI